MGASTLGIGLLVGGIVFNIAGKNISENADEAVKQLEILEKKYWDIHKYMEELRAVVLRYKNLMLDINEKYKSNLEELSHITYYKKDWEEFDEKEKIKIKDTLKFINLLYNMCNVKIVLPSNDSNSLNKINYEEIHKVSSKLSKYV